MGTASLAAQHATLAAAPQEATESMPGGFPWSLAAWCAAACVATAVVLRAEWLRPYPRVGPAWPLRAEPSVLGFGAAFLAAAFGGVAAASALGAGDAAPPLQRMSLQAIGAHAGQLAAVAFLLSVPGFRTRGSATAVGRGGVHQHPRSIGESLLMAVLAAVLAWPVAQAAGGIAALVSSWIGPGAPAIGHRTLEALSASGTGDPWWWAAVGAAVLVGPLAEELVYRGLLQQGLKATGLSARAAVGVTAALFAVVHWGSLTDGARASGLATLLVLGVAWGMLFERTGRIAAPALAHALFNAANLWIAA